MSEHRLEVADVFRTSGDNFLGLWERVNAFKLAAMPATFPSNEQSRAIVLSGRSGCLPLPMGPLFSQYRSTARTTMIKKSPAVTRQARPSRSALFMTGFGAEYLCFSDIRWSPSSVLRQAN